MFSCRNRRGARGRQCPGSPAATTHRRTVHAEHHSLGLPHQGAQVPAFRLRPPRFPPQGLRGAGAALGRQAFLHPRPASRRAGLANRRRRQCAAPRRCESPCRIDAGSHPARRRGAGRPTGRALRGRRRSGVHAPRERVEATHAGGESQLPAPPDPARVSRPVRGRDHRAGRTPMVRVASGHAGRRRPVPAGAVGHHERGGAHGRPARGHQSLPGDPALPAQGPRALPHRRRDCPAGGTALGARGGAAAGGRGRAPPDPDRMPQERGGDASLVGLPGRPPVPARQQGRTEDGMAVARRPHGAGQRPTHAELGVPLSGAQPAAEAALATALLATGACRGRAARRAPARPQAFLCFLRAAPRRERARHRPAARARQRADHAQVHPISPTPWCTRRPRPSARWWRGEP